MLPDFLSCLQVSQALSGSEVAEQSCTEQCPEPSAPHQPSRLLS